MKKKWKTLEEGDTYLYAHQRHTECWIYIRIYDLFSMDKSSEFYWAAEVLVVDLALIPERVMTHALSGFGMERPAHYDRYEWAARACLEHGAHAVMWTEVAREAPKDRWKTFDERDPQFRSLRKRARLYAEEELFDDDNRMHLLETTTVNKIGSTALEYMRGDIYSALRREETEEVAIIRQMYRNADQTLGGEKIPEDL